MDTNAIGERGEFAVYEQLQFKSKESALLGVCVCAQLKSSSGLCMRVGIIGNKVVCLCTYERLNAIIVVQPPYRITLKI